jgi:acyl-CoA reductase-like NAD-dependent aldehyde dehydrogenase
MTPPTVARSRPPDGASRPCRLPPGDGFIAGRQVAEAVAGVAAAFATGSPWRAWQRREALGQAATLVLQRADQLTELISAESSKTVREARAEVHRCAETLRLSAAEAAHLGGQTLPFDDTPRGTGRFGWSTREPVGVVAAITPFNDPLNLIAHKLGPALVAGNGVVLKPAEATPLTALALVEVLLDAGVPADRVAAVPGRGAEAGRALVSNPLVDLISFTGGFRTGDEIARTAGATRLLMELGGNCPVIVCADASRRDTAEAVVAGAFGVAGQNCLSVQRVYVHASRAEEFTAEVVARTRALVVGSKADPGTDVGPLINEGEATRVERWVDEARHHGATVHTGGRRDCAYYLPTVLTDVPPDIRVMTEEVFGPVVSIEPFEDIDHAVRRANDTAYGLQAGVFTRDIDAALDIAARLRVGAVMINDTSDFRIDAMPFGGPKRSGIGREGVRCAIEAMTEPKVVAVRRAAA